MFTVLMLVCWPNLDLCIDQAYYFDQQTFETLAECEASLPTAGNPDLRTIYEAEGITYTGYCVPTP